jgi:hypothetical protein
MRKAILLMILAVVSSNAAADWVEVGGNKNMISYVDPATIRKTGNKVKMWDLIDYYQAVIPAHGKPYMSAKRQGEYNCKEDQSRLLYFSFHSGKKGGGEMVLSVSDPSKWQPVPPESIDEALWKFACGKR